MDDQAALMLAAHGAARAATELADLLSDLCSRLAMASAPVHQSRPALLTTEQAAAELGISKSRVFELIRRDVLDSVKIGNSRRIPRESIGEFVARLRGCQGAA